MSRERNPGEDTTPISFGSIQVDAFVTTEEAMLLDRTVNVERVQKLADEIDELVRAGLEAIKTGLDEKFGDQLDIYIRARDVSL